MHAVQSPLQPSRRSLCNFDSELQRSARISEPLTTQEIAYYSHDVCMWLCMYDDGIATSDIDDVFVVIILGDAAGRIKTKLGLLLLPRKGPTLFSSRHSG